MQLKIDLQIFQKFPGLHLGVIIAKDLNNNGLDNEIENLIRSAEKQIRENISIDTLSPNPKIEAWRITYVAFGAKPKEHKSSIENLCKLVLSGINLRHINKLVDLYNFISLKHMLPVGGEDLDKIKGDIQLTFAGANEPDVLLLGDKDPRPPHEGEVVYKDNISAICRRWNWREADRTKLTEETKNCVLVIESLPPITKEDIETATRELKELVEKYCGGKISYSILDSTNNSVTL